MLSPLHLLFWLPGVFWLLFAQQARPWRAAGAIYLFFLPLMMKLHAKDYYVAPIYPLYFAAGAVLWTKWAGDSRLRNRTLAIYSVIMTAAVAITLPFSVPVLSPPQYVRYSRLLHFQPIESEQHPGISFPEFFADQMGWPQLVSAVSRVYHALPAEQQHQTGIFARNYGEASAINVLGRSIGLPKAISAHQNYFLWGPDGYSGKEMIVVTDQPQAELERRYKSCTLELRQDDKYQMPWEHRGIYLCRDRYSPFADTWRSMRFYK